ncbi:tyrosine recombinase XerC [Nitritalea halalkaliphila LW7]|uniref:Tyrosine recombinase XerC n=1 Tax=Nitritalea halalkaliphila LW7 TaxID=1189621 RepID=I5CAB7_9BACT|nr:tyrosine-type recombinase/integrase [Nitritalea halalkaliphila]EIM78769.1 tyrosine recombinase XerC [Nitritalea halalkaliphila LW7]
MVDSFLNHLTYEKRYSTHTCTAYATDLKQLSLFLEEHYPEVSITHCSHRELRAFIIHLVDSGIQARSVNRKIATLKSFYHFCLRENHISSDPTLKLQSLKTARKLPEFISDAGIESLLHELPYPDTFEGKRDYVLLATLYYTGIRLSELLGLRWEAISIPEQQLKVFGKRKKERIIPIPKPLLGNLISYKKDYEKTFSNINKSDYFIVKNTREPLYPMKVYRIVRHYLDHVAQTTKRSPHVLRHTFATHLLNKGADLNAVKELLGHSGLAATQVYTHNAIEKLKAVFDQAHPKA